MKLKKSKHNKKRNTAFLYEVLIREVTKSVVAGNIDIKNKSLKLCKEFFKPGSILRKEKDIYDSLLSLDGVTTEIREKVLFEAKKDYDSIDRTEVFNQQTKLINKINKQLDPTAFNNFVQNYKDLATVAQILNRELPTKERVLLESSLIAKGAPLEKTEMKPTDNLVYKTFVTKFNQSYSGLLEEQKNLVTYHALSFSDHGLSLKAFLNEELRRLKKAVSSAMAKDYVSSDENMHEKMGGVCDILESFKDKEAIDQDSILKVLEIQELVRELETEEANAQ